jgi:hypothetical protein
MAWQYEIVYRHNDMNPDYKGIRHIWANDEKGALKIIKKNSRIIVESIKQIHHENNETNI